VARRFRREDVEFHSDGFGPRHAAVNVKVWDWSVPIRQVATELGEDPDLAADWWETVEDDDQFTSELFGLACEFAWEQLNDEFKYGDILPGADRVYSEGRSGGWAVPYNGGRPYADEDDVDGWDAVKVAQWGKFARYARAYADDVPYQMASLALLNATSWAEYRDRAVMQRKAELLAVL